MITSPLRPKLDLWVQAGLLGSDDASAIERFETDHAVPPPSRLPLVAEGVGYVGGGLVVAAVGLTIQQRWADLPVTGRVGVVVVPTALAALVGWWVARSDERPLGRLGSVLWLLAGVGVAGSAAEVWFDVIHDGDPPQHGGPLFVGAVTVLAMLAAWWARRQPLQHLALFASGVGTIVGAVDAVAGLRGQDEPSPSFMGAALFLLGAAWLSLGLAQRLTPMKLAALLGSALLLTGPQGVRVDHEHLGLWLGLGAAVGLLVVGVVRSEAIVLLLGTVGLFQWIPQFALFYLRDVLGAEVALGVVGVLLLLVATTMLRLYPTVRASAIPGDNEGMPMFRSRAKPRLPPRWFVRGFWFTHRRLYRLTGGRLGLWRPRANGWGALRLTTVGRRTGLERSVMVGYFEDGPNLVTMAMNGWGEGEPAWWLNLQAHPDARVDLVHGRRRPVRGRAAQGEERERLWSRWQEIDKNLDAYAARRPTGTAVVILEPRP